MEKFLNAWRPRVLSVVRMVSAFLFMQHGGQKLFGFPAAPRGEFDLFSLSGVAGVLELFGGALLLLGLFTRPVAFVLSGLMAFAYFIAHAPRDFWPLNNGGELAIMFCFTFFYLVFAGGGSWSLDCLRAGRR
ncbi:DoxX family protein [Zobellella iuensis]|uniref:DoxX family protein n=1 Tax=Zobellella iuensis TaxID=2803811 RepID=A0ABS1QRD0_9GAMM|nr:DoxX family protein [Zobellella iuensis]MBL1377405.1 DoxX family protein [Zobellella iuensis]